METLFIISALIGGTFLIFQFLTTLLGLEGDGDDSPLSFDPDIDTDSPTLDHSSWLFGVISFRTLVAAATFFGLTGMVMNRLNSSPEQQLAVAIFSGAAAMFGVHGLMNYFRKLSQSGNLKVANAIGLLGTVTVAIPGQSTIAGKVQFQIQGRIEELPAISLHHESIASGKQVEIVAASPQGVMTVKMVGE